VKRKASVESYKCRGRGQLRRLKISINRREKASVGKTVKEDKQKGRTCKRLNI
jgi:hypothetical protein